MGALKSWAQACQKTGGGQPFLELYQAVAAKSNLKKHSPLSVGGPKKGSPRRGVFGSVSCISTSKSVTCNPHLPVIGRMRPIPSCCAF